jgi:hypothetical protein
MWADLGEFAFARFSEFHDAAKILQALVVIARQPVDAGINYLFIWPACE